MFSRKKDYVSFELINDSNSSESTSLKSGRRSKPGKCCSLLEKWTRKPRTQFTFYKRLALNDYSRRTCLFIGGVLTIILCFLTSVISQEIVRNSSQILYTKAVLRNGKKDILILPQGNSNFLNATAIQQALPSEELGVTEPMARLASKFFLVSKTRHPYKYEHFVNKPDDMSKIRLVAIDLKTEITQGIGKESSVRKIDPGFAYIQKRVKYIAKLNPGDKFFLNFGTVEILAALEELWIKKFPDLKQNPLKSQDDKYKGGNIKAIQIPFVVAGIFKKYQKRFQEKLENSIFIDFNSFGDYMIPYVEETYKDDPELERYLEFYKEINWKEFSTEIIVNFKDHEFYSTESFNKIQEHIDILGSKIIEYIHPFAVRVELPIFQILEMNKFGSSILNVGFNVILIGILSLSSYVIYSIMLITVESKVYESAIQRTLGLKNWGLIKIAGVSSLGYSLIAISIGLPLGQFIFTILQSVLDDLHVGIKIGYSSSSIIKATVLCIGIPLYSAIQPVLKLMKNNISKDLDKDRSKTSSVHIKMPETADKFAWSHFWIALTSSVLGICLYVFIPYALLSNQVALLGFIFLGLMIGMLYGMTMIFANFTYIIENLMLKFVKFERKFIKTLIGMNLTSHRIRNRRTIIVYSLSLTFINLIYVVTMMQLESEKRRFLRYSGSKIVIQGNEQKLNLGNWKEVVRKYEHSNLFTYSIIFGDISESKPVKFQNMGKLNGVNIKSELFGVSANMEALSTSFINEKSEDRTQKIALSSPEYLYTREVPGAALISHNLKDSIHLKCQNGSSQNRFLAENNLGISEFECVTSYNVMAGMTMTYIPKMGRREENYPSTAISVSDYWQLFNNEKWNNIDSIPIFRILIKPNEERDDALISLGLRQLGVDVWSYNDIVKRYEPFYTFNGFIFNTITTISMSLCLFSLIATITWNMTEQRKELAVLRSLGVTKPQIARIFMYESLVIISTGAVIGIVVGTSMGWAITLQNSLFMNSGTNLVFPFQLMGFTLLMTGGSSVLAAVIPVYRYLNQSISQLIKKAE